MEGRSLQDLLIDYIKDTQKRGTKADSSIFYLNILVHGVAVTTVKKPEEAGLAGETGSLCLGCLCLPVCHLKSAGAYTEYQRRRYKRERHQHAYVWVQSPGTE